ncbi:helix-turn-helix domain-containing protein [Faecalicatena contorta]|uniref:helix-turn-helix domain-containing protein n=1 Tax=Faecalicatena contorta TaxID=39482 RepID=UPI001F43EE32|nr:helix-turn-helix transcriptional regulator [Faecalicatena contorta]MCF2681521.1 helix-turn-helix transcriptional regulator [Faecalicatena contorta]
MIDVKKVGLFIAECRKSKNWTQKQLGEKLGVTDRAVSKWETGRSLPDICLIEDICKLFDLQVSELLAGGKIEEEDYKKETEQMLIRTIGENQLYGFQVVLHLLEISALLAFYVPFFLAQGGIPNMTVENVFCWLAVVLLMGCTIYLDAKLPARRYRSSNIWIEALNAGIAFLIMVFYVFYINDIADMIKQGESVEVLYATAFIGLALVVGTRVLAVYKRKREEGL